MKLTLSGKACKKHSGKAAEEQEVPVQGLWLTRAGKVHGSLLSVAELFFDIHSDCFLFTHDYV